MAYPLLPSLRTCSRRYPSFEPKLRQARLQINGGLLHCIDDAPLQRKSTTPMLQLGTLRVSFGDRCGEYTPYWMEPKRRCALLLELCHAQNARLQNQQIASRVMLIHCSDSEEHHSQYGTQHMDALIR